MAFFPDRRRRRTCTYTFNNSLLSLSQTEANYNWEYEVKDRPSHNDFGHKESRAGYATQGKYHVTLPDGRIQTVTYTANRDGYFPEVAYEGEALYPAADQKYPSDVDYYY